MASPGFFALFDDIAFLMDDIAVMSKVAMKKTSGIIGDDLAVNANQMTGFSASRELPVVWHVSLGSLVNKAVLIPLALLLSYFLPSMLPILLMVGGLYLCFEGVEKIIHSVWPDHEDLVAKKEHIEHLTHSEEEMLQLEKQKIKAVVRTDFILSGEIVVVTLGMIADKPLSVQAAVLVAIGLAMTIGVYGFVALLVKLDDIGLYLQRKGKMLWLAKILLAGTPKFLKVLSFVGTAAMFMVGGGIFSHHIGFLHHLQESLHVQSNFLAGLINLFYELTVGATFGLVAVGVFMLMKRFLVKN